MKKNDLVQIKTLEEKALLGKTKEVQAEINSAIIDKNMSKLKDLKLISKKKRDLAQILTVLRQKQLVKALESKMQIPEPEKEAKPEGIKR